MLKEVTFRELLQAGSVQSVRLVGLRGGYAVNVRCGQHDRELVNARGDVRLFTLSSAAEFLRGAGIKKFEVDNECFEPGRLRKPRPDRAEAMRKTRTKPRQEALFN